MSFINVFIKEIKIELRSRYSINSALLFSLISVSAVLFSLSDTKLSSQIVIGLYWILIFFSSMASLSRAFVYEIERGSDITLKTLTSSESVFLGKVLYNYVLSLSISVFLFFLFSFFFDSFVFKNLSLFLAEILLGCLGISIASTFAASIVASAGNKSSLFSILCFPVLAPLLVSLIKLNEEIFSNVLSIEDIEFYFLIIFAYCGIVLIVSLFLFELVWED